MARMLEPEKRPEVAVVQDVCDIVAARLRDDYVQEIQSWAFLGQDVTRLVLKQ
jgi:hypothetical protein